MGACGVRRFRKYGYLEDMSLGACMFRAFELKSQPCDTQRVLSKLWSQNPGCNGSLVHSTISWFWRVASKKTLALCVLRSGWTYVYYSPSWSNVSTKMAR